MPQVIPWNSIVHGDGLSLFRDMAVRSARVFIVQLMCLSIFSFHPFFSLAYSYIMKFESGLLESPYGCWLARLCCKVCYWSKLHSFCFVACTCRLTLRDHVCVCLSVLHTSLFVGQLKQVTLRNSCWKIAKKLCPLDQHQVQMHLKHVLSVLAWHLRSYVPLDMCV